MTLTSWLQTLFSGAAGSVIALLGIYFAFLLTSRNGMRVAKATRTAESVALVIAAANDLPRRQASWGWLISERSVVEFAVAAELFAAREARDHPDVAWWTLQQARAVVDLLSNRGCLALGLRPKLATRMAGAMGEVAGTLLDWNAGRRPNSWFAGQNAEEPSASSSPIDST